MIAILMEYDLEHTSRVIAWCENTFGPPDVDKWDYCTHSTPVNWANSVFINTLEFHDHKYATLFRLSWSHINVFDSENELIMHVMTQRTTSGEVLVQQMAAQHGYKIGVPPIFDFEKPGI